MSDKLEELLVFLCLVLVLALMISVAFVATKLEGLLGVICLVLVSILILAVAVVLVLVLILCGNQIGRTASVPVLAPVLSEKQLRFAKLSYLNSRKI